MNFSNLSPGLVLFGLLGLGVALFLLQRLRVRYQPLVVETTLFWREALQEARARVLVKRFRHPWAYLLVFALLALIWLGIAGPEFNGDGARRHLILLDGSDLMAADDRFAAAVDLAEAAVAGLPTDSRSVILLADGPQTLLRPGENPILMRARLGDYQPQKSRLSLEDSIANFVAEDPDRPLGLVVVGDAAVDAAFLEQLPQDSTWRRLKPKLATDRVQLASLGQGVARSGRHDCVDVLLRVRGPVAERAAFELSLAGAAFDATATVTESPDATEFLYLDVPAQAQVLAFHWPGAAHHELMLADLRPLRILVDPNLPEALVNALTADPGLLVTETAGDIVLRRAGSELGSDLPALEVGSKEADLEAFYFEHDEGQDSQDQLAVLVDELGLSSLDGPALAASVGATLRVGANAGPQRKIRLWSELFAEDRGLVSTAEFPVFIGRSLRWLGRRQPAFERAAVGENLSASGLVVGPDGRTETSLAASYRPSLAGLYRDESGREFIASRQDLAMVDAAAEMPTAAATASGGPLALDLILVLALALLVLEWFLVRMGRMP